MKKYRVEAFIIPSNIKYESKTNQIDDEKLATRLENLSTIYIQEFKIQTKDDEELEKNDEVENFQCKVEREEHNSSDYSGLFFDINEHIYDEIVIPENKEDKRDNKKEIPKTKYTKALLKVEDPIYDEPFVGNLTKFIPKNSIENYDVPQNHWTLASSKYKRYGIVAPKLPKRTSSLKSIVEDNESIDSTLQELCCHELKNGSFANNQSPEDISEEIFRENWMRRLDHLKKLETLLKDKEIALQSRERLLLKKEKELRILERLVQDKMRQAELYANRCKKNSSCESINNNERNLESRSSDGSKDHLKSDPAIISVKSDSKLSLENKAMNVLLNPIKSRNLLHADRLSSRVGSARSKSKPRHRRSYDDLDSTLSADIGDSSFIVTSKKFDPIIFKKPAAFTRSASERYPNVNKQRSLQTLASVVEKDKHDFMTSAVEEKTLKRISDNIIATQDQTTKFMNYGSIDKTVSHLNLETLQKSNKSKLIMKKERPVSWSENTDEWLMKKRQAYNLATKQVANQNSDKENSDLQTKLNKSAKTNAKKENNQKKFSIFR